MAKGILLKSLHTVTAIVNVARLIKTGMNCAYSSEDAVRDALAALGYDGTPDPYNLAGAALAQLSKKG